MSFSVTFNYFIIIIEIVHKVHRENKRSNKTDRERHVMTTNPDFKVTVLFEGKYLKTIYNSFTQPAV